MRPKSRRGMPHETPSTDFLHMNRRSRTKGRVVPARATILLLFAALVSLACRSRGAPALESRDTARAKGTTPPSVVAPRPTRHQSPTAPAGATTARPAPPASTATSAPSAATASTARSTAARAPASPAPLAPRPATSPISAAPDTGEVRQVAAAPPPPPPLTPAVTPLAESLARLPFRKGERLEYQVKFGFLGVGSAVLEVVGVEPVRGTPAVHATFSVNGGVRVYRVNDHYESWFEPQDFVTLRATQNIDEGKYERERQFEFFPDRKVFTENGKPEEPTVAEPLDEASFIFFLRTIPLEVGKTYTFERYFRPDRNPVTVTVVRRERVKVPAGTFDAIVVRPTIKTSGIFSEGGRAEAWFSDDNTRTLVQLKSQLKFGSVNLYLRSRTLGVAW